MCCPRKWSLDLLSCPAIVSLEPPNTFLDLFPLSSISFLSFSFYKIRRWRPDDASVMMTLSWWAIGYVYLTTAAELRPVEWCTSSWGSTYCTPILGCCITWSGYNTAIGKGWRHVWCHSGTTRVGRADRLENQVSRTLARRPNWKILSVSRLLVSPPL